MTHIQDIFIRNLRYFRSEKGISQIKFSELIEVSPNYLNAVENGKNFPSIEVIQKIIDELHILPYQLFLEQPVSPPMDPLGESSKIKLIQDVTDLKQKMCTECDALLVKIAKTESLGE